MPSLAIVAVTALIAFSTCGAGASLLSRMATTALALLTLLLL